MLDAIISYLMEVSNLTIETKRQYKLCNNELFKLMSYNPLFDTPSWWRSAQWRFLNWKPTFLLFRNIYIFVYVDVI